MTEMADRVINEHYSSQSWICGRHVEITALSAKESISVVAYDNYLTLKYFRDSLRIKARRALATFLLRQQKSCCRLQPDPFSRQQKCC